MVRNSALNSDQDSFDTPECQKNKRVRDVRQADLLVIDRRWKLLTQSDDYFASNVSRCDV
jgi:hypothetical protein